MIRLIVSTANPVQTLLIALLLAFSSFTGTLLLSKVGLWLAMGCALFALLFEPVAAWRLTQNFTGQTSSGIIRCSKWSNFNRRQTS
jgi:hypothetical protein